MAQVLSKSVEWYAGKLLRQEKFVNLVFGDGEFQVAAGLQTGQRYTQYEEVITEKLVQELRDGLTLDASCFVRATDPNLLNYTEYAGQDKACILEIGRRIEGLLQQFRPSGAWYDGVVWDRASREGKLAPLFKALQARCSALVASQHVVNFFLGLGNPFTGHFSIPDQNCYGQIDQLEGSLTQWADNSRSVAPVFVLCMGLGAIPLAIRLWRSVPNCSVIDLGSALDVFAGTGQERGWRQEMYANLQSWNDCIAKNLEGV